MEEIIIKKINLCIDSRIFSGKENKKDYIYIKNNLEKYYDYIRAYTTNRVIYVYFLKILLDQSDAIKNEIMNILILQNNTDENIINLMNKVLTEKQLIPENSYAFEKSKKIFIEVCKYTYHNLYKNLCWENCVNASPLIRVYKI